jgi:hypothetical protein
MGALPSSSARVRNIMDFMSNPPLDVGASWRPSHLCKLACVPVYLNIFDLLNRFRPALVPLSS